MSDSFYSALPIRVFVYGTLKPGYENYNRYCLGRDVVHTPAIARGLLFQLPMGYPAMTVGEGWVQGFCLRFHDAQLLMALDQLEDFDPTRPPHKNEYQRAWIEIYTPEYQPLGQCWGYQMWASKIQDLRGIPIPSGVWRT